MPEFQLQARLCCGRLRGDPHSKPTLKGLPIWWEGPGLEASLGETTGVNSEKKVKSLCGDQEGHLSKRRGIRPEPERGGFR